MAESIEAHAGSRRRSCEADSVEEGKEEREHEPGSGAASRGSDPAPPEGEVAACETAAAASAHDGAELRRFLERERRALGPMTFAEKAVGGHALLLMVLWFTRASETLGGGWSRLFAQVGVGVEAIKRK